VITGVYELAGQARPTSAVAPVLSKAGQKLYDKIKKMDPSVPQYTGMGAYTGFVDNHNTEGDTAPVGPRSTVRFLAPRSNASAPLHPRWLPSLDAHDLWKARLRKGTADSYVPWGLIGGHLASAGCERERCPAHDRPGENKADHLTREMKGTYNMVFRGEPAIDDIATYTHGMVQAIYEAYDLGPSCTPYEIAVGSQTTKMASCFPCTLFMVAAGYPPSSTHLGRGESWAPLYEPYDPDGQTTARDRAVVRDMNNRWYQTCTEFLALGLELLRSSDTRADHRDSVNDVKSYLDSHGRTPEADAEHKKECASDGYVACSVAATLILDALSLHDWESERINRTLQ